MNSNSRSASKDNQNNKLLFSGNSNFIFGDEDRSRSLFLNNQYLSNFLEFTNHFKDDHPEKIKSFGSEGKDLDQGNLKKQNEDCINKNRTNPILQKSEPRYVNSAQYHRMMIMRIKRAQRELKMQSELQRLKEQLKQNGNLAKRKYKYESRHLHAKNRQRGPDGKFVKKEQEQFIKFEDQNFKDIIEESFISENKNQFNIRQEQTEKKIKTNKKQ